MLIKKFQVRYVHLMSAGTAVLQVQRECGNWRLQNKSENKSLCQEQSLIDHQLNRVNLLDHWFLNLCVIMKILNPSQY